ncbi:MAG TPA: hypothetical protein VH985_04715 [Candidatus Binatia bacterium]|jgi:hypothetical protein
MPKTPVKKDHADERLVDFIFAYEVDGPSAMCWITPPVEGAVEAEARWMADHRQTTTKRSTEAKVVSGADNAATLSKSTQDFYRNECYF